MQPEENAPITALSWARHHRWSWQPPRDFSFVRALRTVSITLSETHAAAACFPLIFAAGSCGTVPQVLLRRSASGQSVFIGPEGQWQAAWLPPRLAAWPFDLICLPDGAAIIGLNEDSGAVSGASHGLAIFAPDAGQSEKSQTALPSLTEAATKAVAPLHRQARELSKTLVATHALEQHGLLAPLDDDPDLQIIDAKAASTVSEAQIVELNRSGALGLFYAGLVSLSHLPWMSRAERHLAAPATCLPRSRMDAKGSGDFLTSLSDAYTHEANQTLHHGASA